MEEKSKKKTYEKPKLRTIELAAEEVLAAGCKTVGGGFAPLASPCLINSCTGLGS